MFGRCIIALYETISMFTKTFHGPLYAQMCSREGPDIFLFARLARRRFLQDLLTILMGGVLLDCRKIMPKPSD